MMAVRPVPTLSVLARIEAVTGVADPLGRAVRAAIRRQVEVDSGQARLGSEAARIARIKEAAAPPPNASPEIIAAPGRGPSIVAPQFSTTITASGPRTRRDTLDGAHPVRAADVFDEMRRKAVGRSKGAIVLTSRQEDAGRVYALLTERVHSSGLRGCSIEQAAVASPGDGGWIEAVIRDCRDLRAMQAAIGDALVLEARGSAAQADRGRRGLKVRYLVDQVCLGQRTPSAVLAATGWPSQSVYRGKLVRALAQALDRMARARPF